MVVQRVAGVKAVKPPRNRTALTLVLERPGQPDHRRAPVGTIDGLDGVQPGMPRAARLVDEQRQAARRSLAAQPVDELVI